MYAQLGKLFLYLLSSNIVCGHPIKDRERKTLLDKDEKKYPNGTIVGKYTYRDKDGSPIHVKYFADDASYGVELKSVKVFGSHPDLLKDTTNLEVVTSDAFAPLEVISKANSLLSSQKNKSYSPFEVLNAFPKDSHKGKKHNSDYEIFLENDLKPSQCGKEKVRVYTDKNKRKIRKAEDSKKFFCDRF